jgi:hypothetical protein
MRWTLSASRSTRPESHGAGSIVPKDPASLYRLGERLRQFRKGKGQRIAYLIWPRISPAGEAVLCTFAYDRPSRMAASTADSSPVDTP